MPLAGIACFLLDTRWRGNDANWVSFNYDVFLALNIRSLARLTIEHKTINLCARFPSELNVDCEQAKWRAKFQLFFPSLNGHKSDHLISPHWWWNCIAQWVGFLLCRDKAKRSRLMELSHLRPPLTAAQPIEQRIRQAWKMGRVEAQSQRKNSDLLECRVNWKGNWAWSLIFHGQSYQNGKTTAKSSGSEWLRSWIPSYSSFQSRKWKTKFPKHNPLMSNESQTVPNFNHHLGQKSLPAHSQP